MKKKSIIAILLTLVMCFSLAGCGEPTPEELLEDAIEITCDELTTTRLANAARAEEKYADKTVALTAIVARVEMEGAYVSQDGSGTNQIQIELDTSVSQYLKMGDEIEVVGTMKSPTSFPTIVEATIIELNGEPFDKE